MTNGLDSWRILTGKRRIANAGKRRRPGATPTMRGAMISCQSSLLMETSSSKNIKNHQALINQSIAFEAGGNYTPG